MRFDKKVLVITGAARGIGRDIALAFAREGADVVVADVIAGDEVVEEIKALGRKAISVKTDVTNTADTTTLMKTAIANFGKVDILVNNAGIARPALLHKMTEEQWDIVIDVDLKGVFNCIHAVAPHMIERGYGKIINISSTASLIGQTGNANYAAAKAGCNAITKTAAKELARYGINVNSVAPSMIETQMTKEIMENPKIKEKYLSWTLLGRFGKPEEVAHAVLFLASDEAGYITGEILIVDGGQTISVA